MRRVHIANDLADPKISAMARPEQVLNGFKSTHAHGSKQSKPRVPISAGILRKMSDQWLLSAMEREDAAMLWAAVSLRFFGFSRSGEIMIHTETVHDKEAHLSFGDITVDDG